MKAMLFMLLASVPSVSSVPSVAQEVAAPQLTPEQKKQLMDQHYAKAFEFYSAKDYPRAIEHWNNILKLDPDQQTAKKLLADAREKLAAQSKERQQTLQDALDSGDYRTAYDALQKLLDADATNQDYLDLQTRLEKVSKLLPSAEGAGKPRAVLRSGVAAYLGLGGKRDLRLAYDALRYAAELNPKGEGTAKVLAMFESENPELADADRLPEGVSILDYKRKASLELIYDGKYAQAVKVCEEVLTLEPADVATLKRYGSAYYQLGKKKTARRIWRKALKLAPDDKQLQKYLGKPTEGEVSQD